MTRFSKELDHVRITIIAQAYLLINQESYNLIYLGYTLSMRSGYDKKNYPKNPKLIEHEFKLTIDILSITSTNYLLEKT